MPVLNVNNRTIFCDDNLDVMNGINSECIDLIYLDPPFNKNKEFTAPIGTSAEGASFKDIFREEDLKLEWLQALQENNPDLYHYLNGIKGIGKPYNFAYLAYMAIRLIECHRVIKQTGSIYLHCDPTMSHYLKTTMDCIFGEENFRNEIIWRRTGSHNSADRFGPIHDVLLFYSKSNNYGHNPIFSPYMKGHVDMFFKKSDRRGRYWTNSIHGAGTRRGLSGEPWKGYNPTSVGRHWAVPSELVLAFGIDSSKSQHEKLDDLHDLGLIDLPPENSNALPTYRQYLSDSKGQLLQDIWAFQPHTKGTLYGTNKEIDSDVRWIPPRDKKERTGFPTQKPTGLLERIIKSSSNEGDVVLDPFCGCATTCVAAERLGRQWIGIDISIKAYELVQKRLEKEVADPGDILKYKNEIHLLTDPPKRTDQAGDYRERKYVYIISHPNYPGEYKVGIAKNWESRLNSYQTSDPKRQYKLEYKLLTHSFRETEQYIHHKFPNKHEWVEGKLDDIVEAIKTYRSD